MFLVEDPSRQFDATHLGILALGLVTKCKSQLTLSDEAQMDFAMTRGEATRPSQMICQLWRDPRLHLGKRGSLVQTRANLSHSLSFARASTGRLLPPARSSAARDYDVVSLSWL
jgi:hypothetical protein